VQVRVHQLHLSLCAQRTRLERRMNRKPVDQGHEGGRLGGAIDLRAEITALLRVAQPIGDAVAPGAVRDALCAGECRTGEGQPEEGEPNAHLGPALSIEGEPLDELRTRELERLARPLLRLGKAAADAIRHRPEREQEQFLLGLEVVHERAGGPSGLLGYAADGYGLQALARRNAPNGCGKLGSALLVVDDLWHRHYTLYRTFDIKQEMELKWILALAFEAAFWLMLAGFLVLRYRYRVERITRVFVLGVVLDTAGILALGVWDFAETGKVSVYTAFIAALVVYSLTAGKEHLRRLDRWMASNLRPSRRVTS
jgi:hypothetical protein